MIGSPVGTQQETMLPFLPAYHFPMCTLAICSVFHSVCFETFSYSFNNIKWSLIVAEIFCYLCNLHMAFLVCVLNTFLQFDAPKMFYLYKVLTLIILFSLFFFYI